MLVSLNISTIENVTLYNVLIIKYNVVVPKQKQKQNTPLILPHA